MSIFGDASTVNHLLMSCSAEAGVIGSGPYTVGILHKTAPTSPAGTVWVSYTADNFGYRGLYLDGDMWVPGEQADTNIPGFGSTPTWYWLVTSKGTGTMPARAHYAFYTASGAMSWVHMDALGNQFDRPPIVRLELGDSFGGHYRGTAACWSGYDKLMTDSEIESTFARSSALLMAASPKFFVHWPESLDIGNPFVDIAGGGVETSRTGLWVTATDPPGFNFSLGRSGKPKTYSGTSWDQHQAKVWDGTTWVPHSMKGYDGSSFIEAK